MKYLKIRVTGVVQGVGFRYYCQKIANKYSIRGYAKNLEDGSVEILASYFDKSTELFLDEIRIGPRHAHIKSITIDETNLEEVYNNFYIY